MNIKKLDAFKLDYNNLSEKLKAIAHPARLRIVLGLTLAENCNVNNIVDNLGIPQSTVSQHLGVLRRCGIIEPKKEGVMVCYRVVDPTILKIIELLKE